MTNSTNSRICHQVIAIEQATKSYLELAIQNRGTSLFADEKSTKKQMCDYRAYSVRIAHLVSDFDASVTRLSQSVLQADNQKDTVTLERSITEFHACLHFRGTLVRLLEENEQALKSDGNPFPVSSIALRCQNILHEAQKLCQILKGDVAP